MGLVLRFGSWRLLVFALNSLPTMNASDDWRDCKERVKKFFLILLPVLESEFCFVLGMGGQEGKIALDLQGHFF